MNEREPKPEVAELVREHLRNQHGIEDFDPERDLSWSGNEPEAPLAHYLPESGWREPGARCSLCPRSFYAPPSFGHPERNEALRRQYRRELEPLLRGLGPDEQERVITDWDRGRLAQANLARVDRHEAQATRRERDPETSRRIGACQRFLLAEYRQHGKKERALNALVALAREDPERHREIVGRDYPFSRETYKGYWRKILLETRQEAKREGLANAASEQAARKEAAFQARRRS